MTVEPSAPPTVSVLIVNWNAGPMLARCLASLRAHPPDAPIEVIVVDNASTDDSVSAAKAELPSVRVVANATNRGLSAANNQAIGLATAPYLLVSNPDVEYGAGSIDALVSLLERRDGAAIAVPQLQHPDGTIHTSAGDLPTLREALLGRRASARRHGTEGFWWDGWAHDEERRIGRGHEAAYLVRRRAIDDVGLQDERFPLDWEGIDWTARFADRGWEVWFTPAAKVVHHGGQSVRQVQRRWVISSHRGMYRYFAKRSPAIARPALAVVVAARAGVKLAALAITRDVYPRH
jgi:GT2 family glycosyltransferase